jgi:M6 family metalloprotease-like protein
MPTTLTQPDGSTLECFASGDEYHNWLHDKDNYTIIQSQDTGYYMYAVKSGTAIVAGKLIAGKDNPALGGLTPKLNISQEEYKQYRSTKFQTPPHRSAPTIGTINNLVVYVRFSGEAEFGQTISTYDGWFNTNTNSLTNYFQEASYNQLAVNTTFYPAPVSGNVVSWQDTQHTRAYFQPYNATTNTIGYQDDTQRTDREFTLLASAIAGVAAAVPADLVIDSDGDGNVDNVVFIISGAAGAWSSLLWPHRWSIYDRTVTLRGKRVYDFNFQLKDFLTSSSVGVLCHEFFHSLGAPDLYHYASDSTIDPVGSWDVMEATANPPQHMGAFMKWKYGHWIPSVTTLNSNGTYNLNPVTSSTNNCYRINSPNSTTEYFMVEYRRKTGTYENSIPGSGLLVYRINTLAGEGNAEGPPDEVYIYRPNGTTTVNGTTSSANYSLETGRTSISSTTNPTPFLSSGAAGGLTLLNIGSAGATITFDNGVVTPGMPVCSITSPATGSVFNQGSTVTISVTATDTSPGTVNRVDFYLDGATIPTATDNSYPYSWNWNTTSVSAGSHTITAKAVDNENNIGQSFVDISILAPADEGFETNNFSAFAWTFSGGNWFVQSTEKYSGTYAAQSAAIVDNSTTSMNLEMTVSSPGNIAFFQKVSSETNYDFLKFYLDGTELGSWSGAGSWVMQSYAVTAGLHTFCWAYSKDTNTTGGSDCAWVDHISFPPHTIVIPPTITWNPSSISKSMLTNLSSSQNLIIGNTGGATLNWVCSLPTSSATVLAETFATTSIPTGWTETLVSGDALSWVYAAGGYSSHPASAQDGAYNARLYKNSATASVVKLITPALNLSGASSAALSFWHTQELWSSDQDELRVYYGNSVSGPWTVLATYTNSIASWTQETLALPNLSASYFIAFEGTAKYGYGVCLDNILVTKESAVNSDWLSLNGGSTASGSILAAGANQTVTVGFDTAGITPGTYNSTITLSSNSSTNSIVNIPVELFVSAPQPQITVSITSKAFGTVLVNTTQSSNFQISNAGTATLTGNIVTPVGYTVALARADNVTQPAKQAVSSLASHSKTNERNSLPYTVAAGANHTYTISFNPTAVQAYNGNITISHNATGASKTIALTGQGGKPTIGLSAASFAASHAPGQSGNQTLTISNSGNMSLSYSLTIASAPAWLRINGGTTVSNTIAVSGSAQNITMAFNATGMSPGVYNATINGSTNDTANASFNIPVELSVSIPITISAPTGGQTWESGTNQTIQWEYTGAGTTVAFAYSTNGGSIWINGGDKTVNQGTNSFIWVVPYAASTNCKIRLTDSISPNYLAISNVFAIAEPAPPSTPDNLTLALENLSGTVTLSWSAPTGNPDSYVIYFCPTPAFDAGSTTLLATVPSSQNTFQDTLAGSRSSGFYRVVAVRNPPVK